MLSASQITFLTLTASIPLTVILTGICLFFNRRKVDTLLVTNLLSNNYALIPVVCLIWNILFASYHSSFYEPLAEEALSLINDNGTTLSLSLCYAAILMLVSIFRNMRAACSVKAD